MKKEDRQRIYDKFGGKCAYCGCELQKGWNVDHIDPHWHTVNPERALSIGLTKGGHEIGNLNPSCPRCNKWKSTFTIEQFREQISLQVIRLNSYSSNYRMAKDYGLLLEINNPVTFYFETHTKVI